MMTDHTIPTTTLGAGGPEVGVQGLGCMGMSFAYGPADADASRAALERALERGSPFTTRPTRTARATTSGSSPRSSRRTATRC